MSDKKRRVIHALTAVLLLIAGAAGFMVFTKAKPPLEKAERPSLPPLVRTVKVNLGAYTVQVTGQGTVRPLRETSLSAQVGGKVVHVSPALVDGGTFSQGEELLRIEPADYELAVTLARASVKDSESRVRLTEEEAVVAREEWRLHRSGGTGRGVQPPPLVAKEPQLAAARAKLEADRANLKKARLNLERTRLTAPFDGRVSMKNVGLGQQVAPGQVLATLYSIEAAEIIVPLEDSQLAWFHVPGFTPGDDPGSPARIEASLAGRRMSWPGRVVRAEGTLDEKTRLINVVVRVDRPYERRPPLAAGLFVSLTVEGRELERVGRIPRSALRQGGLVWVVDGEDRMRFRPVKIAHTEGDFVLIETGLSDGDRVVVSQLKAPTDGMLVRLSAGEPSQS
ncbi:MAG: efflux RND transporter periplasmic adaptor subunit [Proteobacteria bacterium]|nr:efflux RND transporter periplasmic adaptor subunit [Pseudomonadota bacterium]